MEEQEKLALKMMGGAIRRHPIAVGIIMISTLIGAIAGVFAYYNGWLG